MSGNELSKKDLTCIGCPMGCALIVELEGKKVIRVLGSSCKIGENYGKKECTNPTRVVTSSVIVTGGESEILSVKTESDIPKSMIYDCIGALKNVVVKAPVHIGDVVLKNVLNTGVNIIATKEIQAS
jgi:CxxC motif-containing protein